MKISTSGVLYQHLKWIKCNKIPHLTLMHCGVYGKDQGLSNNTKIIIIGLRKCGENFQEITTCCWLLFVGMDLEISYPSYFKLLLQETEE
jgi:hypothetical protein